MTSSSPFVVADPGQTRRKQSSRYEADLQKHSQPAIGDEHRRVRDVLERADVAKFDSTLPPIKRLECQRKASLAKKLQQDACRRADADGGRRVLAEFLCTPPRFFEFPQ